MFQFVLSTSSPVTEHHWRRVWLCLLALSHQVFTHIAQIHPFLTADQPPLERPCNLNHLCYLLLDSLLPVSCTSEGHLDTALQMCFTSAKQRGRIPSLILLAVQGLLALLGTRTHCCLMLKLLCTRMLIPSLQKWSPSGQPPAYTGPWSYSSPAEGLYISHQRIRM